jgi:hypothetical protein
MKNDEYFFVNGQRGINITKGGIYSPWPIPAAKILMANKDWPALQVLTCLITHLGYGKSSNLAFPSISTICKETGRGKGKVQEGIKSLVAHGFIRKRKQKAGRFSRNEYEILDTCYQMKEGINKEIKKEKESEVALALYASDYDQLVNTPNNNSNETIDPWLFS